LSNAAAHPAGKGSFKSLGDHREKDLSDSRERGELATSEKYSTAKETPNAGVPSARQEKGLDCRRQKKKERGTPAPPHFRRKTKLF